MRILVGYNGTDFARAAIEDMRRAGFPFEAAAHVVTIAETCFPTVKTTDAEALAAEGVELVRGLFPNWTITSSTVTGAPVRELISAANNFHADLIVLGEPNKRNEGGENLFLGPVSQGLLTECDIQLRISRQNDDRWSHYPRLLLGFDGSAGSERAIQGIASRSWPKGTLVRVISIEGSGIVGSIGHLSPQLRAAAIGAGFESKWAETLAEHAMHELDKAGMCTELEVRSGNPQKVLIEAADEWSADCIFVAPHCSGNSYERFLLGSVSAAVAAHANCTVEIMR
ncbi:MAG TPA: universal stress protein [Pyrinomonadaceae bacterium]|nr:universal stress protein [Pyrinomonadaceae bacterium]